MPPLIIDTPNDWNAIATIHGPVIDPMIVRCGELFLRGASGIPNPSSSWDLLTRNTHAIGTFFDRIVLDNRIPLFNYADTFDLGQNFDGRTLAQVNAAEEIFVPVDVRHHMYQQVRAAAGAELRKLYQSPTPGISLEDANSILGELTDSGYAWYPQLAEVAHLNQSEQRLASFLLGGLIFGGYAQLTGSDHLMQPKRSRLFLAVSLGRDTSRKAEEILFKDLGELTQHRSLELPYTPTFFPYLLTVSDTPSALLANALQLRHSPEVRDYRQWLATVRTDFDINGRIANERLREVQNLANSIRKRLEAGNMPEVEIKLTLSPAELKPELELNLTAPLKAAWGWMLDQLPSRRHHKLLTRAIMADHEYYAIENRIQTVWKH